MRKRTKAREIALQMLYQIDIRKIDIRQTDIQEDAAVEGLDDHLVRQGGVDDEVRAFAEQLIHGTREHVGEIDSLISSAAQNWEIRRMAIVDRNILRMAVYEMLHAPDIPSKVSINEAIELGKRFSTQQSGSFINGILDRIRREQAL